MLSLPDAPAQAIVAVLSDDKVVAGSTVVPVVAFATNDRVIAGAHIDAVIPANAMDDIQCLGARHLVGEILRGGYAL